MARGRPSVLLNSVDPTTLSKAQVTIGHIQLRDVLVCPHERGVVYYPHSHSIVEHDLTTPSSQAKPISDLTFLPNSLSSLVLPSGDTLLAAGGQEAELHLSLFSPPSTSYSSQDERQSSRHLGRRRWKMETTLPHASINNSVHLTNLNLCGSNESSVEPRLMVSNNDRTVKFFDISLYGKNHYHMNGMPTRLPSAGELHLDVPVNHSSISPDGRTLLSVGDSPDVYLHRISGGARLSFTLVNKFSLSPYINAPMASSYNHPYSSSAVPASFSTAFSANGSKFAVASQEGVVVVWDVRSTKPLKVIQTDKSRSSEGLSSGNGSASGWVFESWDWTRNNGSAPGWGVRSIKFSPGGSGQEIMTFTEHTSMMHVVDARTFETEEIVRIPNFESPASSRPSTARPRSSSPPPRYSPSSYSSSEALLPPPPRILLFSGAFEDTFRVPVDADNSRNTSRPRRNRRRDEGSSTGDDDVDGIVVIPPLGDREVENDVRRLLGRPVRRIPLLSGSTSGSHDDSERDYEGDHRGDDDMDVDELETDCLSSHNPSRSTSPIPGNRDHSVSPSPIPSSFPAPATSAVRMSQVFEQVRSPRPATLLRRESSGPYVSRRPSSYIRRIRPTQDECTPKEVDQDLAGICFDPSGRFVYVASTKGIAEWTVRGAEKSWWIDSAWA
ncbi:hypothetical protein QCA50_014299 [Cerrena zonata]|uniref:DUF2415 domain-containing protein n=1 Tax=Cerrena zonata TaxID=2478898 RepID=A0AAW0FSH4_9APHY